MKNSNALWSTVIISFAAAFTPAVEAQSPIVITDRGDVVSRIYSDNETLARASTYKGASESVHKWLDQLREQYRATGAVPNLRALPADSLPSNVVIVPSNEVAALPTRPSTAARSIPVLYVDANATGPTEDGLTWCTAFKSLSAALDVVFIPLNAQTIRVAKGTYKPSTIGLADPRDATFNALWLFDGSEIRGGYAGCGAADPDERDYVLHPTILSGDIGVEGNDADNCYNVVSIGGLESGLVEGFVITKGNANHSSVYEKRNGGGMYTQGSAIYRDCVFLQNSAVEVGGGVFVASSLYGDAPEFERCTFKENDARDGGGLFNFGRLAKVTDCRFVKNVGVDAGALNIQAGNFVFGPNETSVTNCEFVENVGRLGGAIINWGSPKLTNTRIVNNRASEAGGALYSFASPSILGSGLPVLDRTTICDNSAALLGGGVFQLDGEVTISNSVLWGNTSQNTGWSISSANPDKQILLFESSASVDWSNVQGGWNGAGANNLALTPKMTPSGHLLADSPLRNAGDPSYIPDLGLTTDLDGDAVEADGRIDIGADEFVDTDGDRLPDWYEAAHTVANTATGSGLNPGDDLDGDGVTNLEEYEIYSSIPAAQPYYVDDGAGSDTNDGLSLATAKKTIQAGLDAASEGDTVLVVAGTYKGVGNRALDFKGKSVVLRSISGAADTTIDAESSARVFDFHSQEKGGAAIVGFTIKNGRADVGGGLRAIANARPQVRDSLFVNNQATGSGGAILALYSGVRLKDVSIDEGTFSAPGGAADFIGSDARIEGLVDVQKGIFRIRKSHVDGVKSSIDVMADASVEATEGNLWRTGLSGLGDMRVFPESAELKVQGDSDESTVELSIASIQSTGRVAIRKASLRDLDVNFKNVKLEDGSSVLDSTVDLVEASQGFGGEFAVSASSEITGSDVTSFADRYLGVAPDPNAVAQPVVTDNLFRIKVPSEAQAVVAGSTHVGGQFAASLKGKSLELRMADVDCSGLCSPGAYPLPSSSAYSDNWAVESLELEPNAVLNLTNRLGFLFEATAGGTGEAIYVRDLTLRSGAVLNTAGQRLYYQNLVSDEGARVVDAPIHGLSLSPLRMDNDVELDVRLTKRLTDDADFVEGSPPPPLPEGSISRSGGVLLMRTLSASSVAAKAAFSRAAEDEVVIAFKYRFVQGMIGTAEIVVYLSDQRDASQGLVEVARIRPPAQGRAGSIGNGQFASFFATFPRGSLNLTAGSYVELELRSKNSVVQVDDWEPLIKSVYANDDVSGDNVLSKADYLYVLRSFGEDLTSGGLPQWALDHSRSEDRRIDLTDLLEWDAEVDAASAARTAGESTLDFTKPEPVWKKGVAVRSDSSGPGTQVAGQTVIPANRLVMGGKRASAGDQEDYIFTLDLGHVSVDSNGKTAICAEAYADGATRPRSNPGAAGYRGNGRIFADSAGELYQIHATQGIIRIRDGEVVVPPGVLTFAGNIVSVGASATVAGGYTPKILRDSAFSHTNSNAMFVAPVVVLPPGGRSYEAVAKIELTPDGPDPYVIQQLYGVDPSIDPMINTDPPEASEIDVQNISEIEIDSSGRLYVLSTKGDNANDWLLVYDEGLGTTSEQRFLLTDSAPNLKDPTGLSLSLDGSKLYLASAVNDAATSTTKVYEFSTETAVSGGLGVSLLREIDIENMRNPTAIIEAPATGDVYVVGLKSPLLDEFNIFAEDDALFTRATFAVVKPTDDSVTAADLNGAYTVAIPVTEATTCVSTGCVFSECIPISDLIADPSGINKARFISFAIPASATAAASETALRVNLVSLHHVDPPYTGGASVPFTAFEGQIRWVGPPAQFVESVSSGTPFYASQLQCDPYYQDWSTIGLLHVAGGAIVPSSTYEIENVASSCQGNEAKCTAISAALSISTTRWGDVVDPFNPPSTTTQPDFGDIGALVNKFKSALGAPIKARALLAGTNANGDIDPTPDLGFTHISACVDAFKGLPYPYTIASCP